MVFGWLVKQGYEYCEAHWCWHCPPTNGFLTLGQLFSFCMYAHRHSWDVFLMTDKIWFRHRSGYL
jgi:hypothetical protein